jgi:hypothetical protein
MDASVFKKVAIGVVAENIEVKSGTAINNTVRVTPTEWLSMRDGELANNPTPMTYKSQDAQGVETQGGFITNNTIPCEWLPAGANRLTPPTVRRGMRVELFQTADEAKYYWRYLGLDDHLMKLETIIFGISANTTEQKPGEKMPLDPKSMYWFEMSSHSKKVALQTSKVNGEFCSYEMFFDLAGGEFSVNDDLGNWMLLNSKNHLIHLQNQDGTFVKLDRKDIKAYAPQNIEGRADKDIKLDAGQNISLTAGQNIDLDAKQNCRAKGGVLASIDGGGSILTLTAGGTVLKSPQFDGGP